MERGKISTKVSPELTLLDGLFLLDSSTVKMTNRKNKKNDLFILNYPF
jgi:hypothetical protein